MVVFLEFLKAPTIAKLSTFLAFLIGPFLVPLIKKGIYDPLAHYVARFLRFLMATIHKVAVYAILAFLVGTYLPGFIAWALTSYDEHYGLHNSYAAQLLVSLCGGLIKYEIVQRSWALLGTATEWIASFMVYPVLVVQFMRSNMTMV
jgi:hypothetical protein